MSGEGKEKKLSRQERRRQAREAEKAARKASSVAGPAGAQPAGAECTLDLRTSSLLNFLHADRTRTAAASAMLSFVTDAQSPKTLCSKIRRVQRDELLHLREEEVAQSREAFSIIKRTFHTMNILPSCDAEVIVHADLIESLLGFVSQLHIAFFYIYNAEKLLASGADVEIESLLEDFLNYLSELIDYFNQHICPSTLLVGFYEQLTDVFQDKHDSFFTLLSRSITSLTQYHADVSSQLKKIQKNTQQADYAEREQKSQSAYRALMAEYRAAKKPQSSRRRRHPHVSTNTSSGEGVTKNNTSSEENAESFVDKPAKPRTPYREAKSLFRAACFADAKNKLESLSKNPSGFQSVSIPYMLAICCRMMASHAVSYSERLTLCEQSEQYLATAKTAQEKVCSLKPAQSKKSEAFTHLIVMEIITVRAMLQRIQREIQRIIDEHEAVMQRLTEQGGHRGGNEPSTETQLFRKVRSLQPTVRERLACVDRLLSA